MDVEGKGAVSVEDLGRVAGLPNDIVNDLAAQFETQALAFLEAETTVAGEPSVRGSARGSVATRASTVFTRNTTLGRGRSARRFLEVRGEGVGWGPLMRSVAVRGQ